MNAYECFVIFPKEEIDRVKHIRGIGQDTDTYGHQRKEWHKYHALGETLTAYIMCLYFCLEMKPAGFSFPGIFGWVNLQQIKMCLACVKEE